MKKIKVMVLGGLILTQIASIYTAAEATSIPESESAQQKKRKNGNHSAGVKEAEDHVAGKQESNAHGKKSKKHKQHTNPTHKSKPTSPHKNKHYKKQEKR